MYKSIRHKPTHTHQYIQGQTVHGGFTLELCYNSGHISNLFSPLFYPKRLDFLTPFHTMWPRIDIQNILKPQWVAHTDYSQIHTNPHIITLTNTNRHAHSYTHIHIQTQTVSQIRNIQTYTHNIWFCVLFYWLDKIHSSTLIFDTILSKKAIKYKQEGV